jgi:hypothetical protein
MRIKRMQFNPNGKAEFKSLAQKKAVNLSRIKQTYPQQKTAKRA